MLEIEIGREYRDNVKGVVGKAVATVNDEEGRQHVQLELRDEHLDHTPTAPQGHDLRWYLLSRLELVA